MRKFIITILAASAAAVSVSAQTSNVWSLQDCLDYAVKNNIQIQQNRNTYLSGLEDTEQAKASLFPSFTASSSQGVTNYTLSDDPSTKYTGSYGLNADMTLYSGGKLRNAVKQQEVQNEIDSLSVTSSINDIKIAIIQAYMQCLYAQEAVKVNENTVELAQAQYDRAVEMKNAGSLSKVDVAQLESQLYSDQYQLTVAKTSLDSYLLALKQLLELDILDEIQLSGAEASEEDVLQLIPEKTIVYQNALAYLPEVRSADLSVTSAELALKTAKAGYSPTLGLSAGAGASNMSGTGNTFTTQIQNNFNLNAGLTLSIPIFSNRKNKTAVNKAKYTLANSELTKLNTEKTVLKEVESTYLDAVSAQAQYVSAKQQEQYAQTSYDLTNEQFSLGMKNIVELIEAKNNLLSASQSRLQAKYMALLNLEVLDVYQGK